MENRSRTAKVLISLVASMTFGTFVLMSLDKKAISAGAFSLASYTTLNSVENAAKPMSASWDSIEVYCRKGGYAEDSHFAVLNENGQDGAVECISQKVFLTPLSEAIGARTIRICVVADSLRDLSDSQMKRTADLVEMLSRKCRIAPKRIKYPENWQI